MMPIYLLLLAFLVPVNIWAAITPHLHSELSMRILHLVSSAVLLPPLFGIWMRRGSLAVRPLALVFAVFLVVMLVVNLWISWMGMGVEKGWLDHLFLSLASASVIAFYFMLPDETQRVQGNMS